MLIVVRLSVIYAECHYAECRYAECRGTSSAHLSNTIKLICLFFTMMSCRTCHEFYSQRQSTINETECCNLDF
jgi:hypothetical protein